MNSSGERGREGGREAECFTHTPFPSDADTHTHTHLLIYLLQQRSQMHDKVLPKHTQSL